MTQTEQSGDRPRVDIAGLRAPLPVRVIGWVLGALSFLNLIRDLTYVEVYGLVREWLDTYDLLIRRLCGFLFGWIDWRWIRLDDAEGHVLVLAVLVGAMAGRASYRTELDKGNSASMIRETMLAILGIGGFIAGLLLLVPAPAGFWFGLFYATAFLASAMIGGELSDEEFMSSRHFRREFVIVGACVVIVLLIGHFLAAP